MGTRFEIVAGGDDPILVQAAVEEALEEVASCHRAWNAFASDSLLATIHRNGYQRAIPVDALTLDLLLQCQQLHRASGGCFDPAIGADLVGADPRPDRCGGISEPTGMDAVEIDAAAATVRLLHRRIRLDLGGVAKGYACDLAGEVLRASGVHCALIHGGTSSVVAIGAPPGREEWAIEVAGSVPERVFLRDACMSISAPSGGRGDGHLVDPGSGQRVAIDHPGVLVTGPRATDCDAWATSLAVAISRKGCEMNLPVDFQWRTIGTTEVDIEALVASGN